MNSVVEAKEWHAVDCRRPLPPEDDGGPPIAFDITWCEQSPENQITFKSMGLLERILSLLAEHLPMDHRNEFTLRLSLEEAIANIARYGFPPEDVQVSPEKLRVVLTITEKMSEARHALMTLLEFFDQGPDLPKSPEEFAKSSTDDEHLEDTHGRGFKLMLDLGEFSVTSERIDPSQKVIRLEREFMGKDSEGGQHRHNSGTKAAE